MIDHPSLPPLRRVAVLVLVCSAWLAQPAAGQTQTTDVFTVDGVDVDVTSETAAVAREAALADGERTAFRRLLERLTLRADQERLPSLPQDKIATYVKDFEVAEEKSAAGRYLATLNFRFKAEEIRRLLRDHDLPFAETPSKPVLVLPLYEAAGALMLWDDPNPWRDAWAARPPADGLVPLILPLGDLNDLGAIGAEQAAKGDIQSLTGIARRYGAGNTLVVHGNLGMDSRKGTYVLDVLVTRYGGVRTEATIARLFTAATGEETGDLLQRAAADIAAEVEDTWKNANLMRFGRPTVLAVVVPIGNLGEWLNVRRKLSRVAVISSLELVLLSRDEVRVNLHYIGDPDQLSVALEQTDLVLYKDGDDWVLELAPAAPARDS